MKAHPSKQEVSDKASSSGPARSVRRDPAKLKEQEYRLDVSYYCTMKPQRVYPLVVGVARRRGPIAADRPTGVEVTLRPIVPGAVVVPAELPLDVTRPGARATFHVTPLVLGRLPATRIQVLHGGRPVQEVATRMRGKRQRLSWILLLLAIVAPLLLVYWTRTAPLRGLIIDRRKNPDYVPPKEGELPPEPGKPPLAPGGGMAPPPITPPRPPEYIYYQRPGTPGEMLTSEVHSGLRNNLPDLPGTSWLANHAAEALGTAYASLCSTSNELYPGFYLGLLLLTAAFGSWAFHRPARVRTQAALLLPTVPATATLRPGDNAETLPLVEEPG